MRPVAGRMTEEPHGLWDRPASWVHRNSTAGFVMSLHGFRAVGYDGVVGCPCDVGIQGEREERTNNAADELGGDER